MIRVTVYYKGHSIDFDHMIDRVARRQHVGSGYTNGILRKIGVDFAR